MDLAAILQGNGQSAEQLGQAAGINAQDAGKLIGKLLPALTGGIQSNLSKQGGLEALSGALQSGNHQRYIDNPAELQDSGAVAEGNGILGHLLGSKDASRQLASKISSETGVDTGSIKKALPLVAALAMGALSKQTDSGKQLQGDAGSILGSLLGGGDNSSGLGALAGMAKKFL